MRDLLIQLLTIVLQLLIAAVLGFVIDFIKAKTGKEKFNKYFDLAKMAVTAIEQQFTKQPSGVKKQIAVKFLSAKLNNKLQPPEINNLIEAAVFEMNTVIKNKTTPDTSVLVPFSQVQPVSNPTSTITVSNNSSQTYSSDTPPAPSTGGAQI